MKTIALVAYLVIGVVIAGNQGYLGDVGSIGDVLNLLLAVLLWPLLLAGVDFNLKIGGGIDTDGDRKKGSLLLVGPVLSFARAARLRRRCLRWPVPRPASGR